MDMVVAMSSVDVGFKWTGRMEVRVLAEPGADGSWTLSQFGDVSFV
jgi:hypothetical protein